MDNLVPDEVRRLIASGVSTMDHVDLLFHLHQRDSTVGELAAVTRFDAGLVAMLIADLEGAGLVNRNGDRLRVTADRRSRDAIDELLTIYNARPVTLVRAIYRANV